MLKLSESKIQRYPFKCTSLNRISHLLVRLSCVSKKCLCTSCLEGWSAAKAMSAVMRPRLTEPASSQYALLNIGWRPVLQLFTCSTYCRSWRSWMAALTPSPTDWLWRLQFAMRMAPIWKQDLDINSDCLWVKQRKNGLKPVNISHTTAQKDLSKLLSREAVLYAAHHTHKRRQLRN